MEKVDAQIELDLQKAKAELLDKVKGKVAQQRNDIEQRMKDAKNTKEKKEIQKELANFDKQKK